MPHRRLLCSCLALFCFCLLLPSLAHSGPWGEPGDVQFRHDLYLLRDSGHIQIPLSAWPLSMGDVAEAVSSLSEQDFQDPHVLDAFQRIKDRLRQESRTGFRKPFVKLSLNNESFEYRTFQDTPRGKGELDLGLEWMGKRFAFRLEGQVVRDPEDNRNFRPDGTMGGMILGNWLFSVGYMSRWWSPSPADSLILSSNARPFPAVSLQRNVSEPFDLPVLKYLGRWNLRAFAGLLEEDRAISRPKFLGMRLDLCPSDKIEIGFSRTLFWGGKGEPEKLDNLAEVFFTGDNQVQGQEGLGPNQLAGFDFRWRSPLYGDFPYALYGQFIGEDEAGNMPSHYIGQAGLEHWGSIDLLDASYRMYGEIADTKAEFYTDDPTFGYNYAYNHGKYETGYRYRGRSMGHGLDNDSLAYTLGGSLVREDGTSWNGFLRYARVNRDEGGQNSFSATGEQLYSGQLSRSFRALKGQITLGARLSYTDPMQDSPDSDSDTEVLGFITWQNRVK